MFSKPVNYNLNALVPRQQKWNKGEIPIKLIYICLSWNNTKKLHNADAKLLTHQTSKQV